MYYHNKAEFMQMGKVHFSRSGVSHHHHSSPKIAALLLFLAPILIWTSINCKNQQKCGEGVLTSAKHVIAA